MITKIVLIAVALLVSGCATSYQKSGMTGGFSETKLGPDVVRVVFRGNGYTRKERSQDLALLRAAELTQQAGYSHFVVLNEQNETKAYTTTTAGTSHTTGVAQTLGNRTVYSGQAIHNPGQTITAYKPETGLLVQFLKEKPEGVFAFEAAFLVSSLKEKYDVK